MQWLSLCVSALLLVSVAVLLPAPTRAEIFTAIADMEPVLYAEKELARQLRDYIQEEEDRLTHLKNIADDYEAHADRATEDTHTYLSNPVNAFLLVKRFTHDWSKVKQVIQNNNAQEFLEGLSPTLAFFPTDEDMSGAATALLRLQDTYALPTEKLARGEIQGVKYSPTLTADECFEIGRKAYNEKDYYHTILWMGEALKMLDEEVIPTTNRAVLLDYLSFALYSQGNLRAAYNLTIEWLQLEPNHQRATSNKNYYEQMLAEREALRFRRGDDGSNQEYEPEEDDNEIKNKRIIDDYRASEEFSNYEKMCRGETVIERPEIHHLTCQFKSHHPMFYIQPLREETMSIQPWIVVYHNLLFDHEIESIKQAATPKLHRSGVFQYPGAQHKGITNYRTSKSAWIGDNEHEKFAHISRRVSAATNLTLDTAEHLQVVNYGIGGHYEPHFDFARKEESGTFDINAGNRIATAIFYMTDVEAGGATVFTNIDVKLWPEKGALGFWYNLLRNGEGDYETRHAACPVLTGSKWVCNKWIHERGQEFTRSCDLSPMV